MDETKHTTTHEPPQLNHETSDADVGAIAKSGVVLAIIAAVVLVLMLVMANYFEKENTRATPAASPLAAQRMLPPDPRLQVKPEKDLVQLRAAEDSTLHNYGWLMREANVVHIPIERAIELTAQRGLPARNEERREKSEGGELKP